jgi:hypothetical protein
MQTRRRGFALQHVAVVRYGGDIAALADDGLEEAISC